MGDLKVQQTTPKTAVPRTTPALSAEALARVDLFLARGDAARSLAGSTLHNEIGAALQLAPNHEPTTAADHQRLEVGDWPFYSGVAEDSIKVIAAAARSLNGGKEPVSVAVLPLVYTDATGKSLQVPLFRIDGPDGTTSGFVDTQGRHYADLTKWKSENKFPPGQVSYPTAGHLKAGPDGKALMTTEATHATIDTPLEHLVDWAEKAGMVGGFVVGGAALIGVGGVVMPVVGTVLALGFGAKAALGLVDSERHGETLNPLKSTEARNNWLTAGASMLGLGGAAAAARAAGEVAALGQSTSAFARSATALTVASEVAGGVQTVDGAVQLASGWKDLSVKDRMLAASQLAFYAASTGKQLAGKSAYSMEGARAKLDGAPGPVLAGSRRAQQGAVNLDAFMPSKPPVAAGPTLAPPSKHVATPANSQLFSESPAPVPAPKRTTTGSFAAVKVAPQPELVPNARLDKQRIRTWNLKSQGEVVEVPIRKVGTHEAKQLPETEYKPVAEKQLATTVKRSADVRLKELQAGAARKPAALATPEDGSTVAKAFHMAVLGADQTGFEYPLAMAHIGEAEGFRVVLRCHEELVPALTARLAKEKLDNVTLLPIKKGDQLDFWSEDQGELHVDGSVSVPRRLTAEEGMPYEEVRRLTLKARLERLHPRAKGDPSTQEGMADLLKRFPDINFSSVGAVGERGGQRALAAIATGSGDKVRMSSGYLEGGNSLVGRKANGEPYVLVGKDSLAVSRAGLEKDLGRPVTDAELRTLVAGDYGVKPENLVAIEQPNDFHIDMFMMLLPNGQVVLNDSKQAVALSSKWLQADLDASKPAPLPAGASKAATERYENDLSLWQIGNEMAPENLKFVQEKADRRAPFEAKIAEQLAAAGLTVHRVAGVFDGLGGNFGEMNFLNGEHATAPNGDRFSIVLGGEPRAEQNFLRTLTALPNAPKRVHFLDRALTPTTLSAQGGISCRAKLEGVTP